MTFLSNISNTVAISAAGAGLAGCLALSGLLWWQGREVADLRTSNAALTLRLGACDASAENIKQDKDSDNEVDNIPDDGLRNAPDRWMLNPSSGGVD